MVFSQKDWNDRVARINELFRNKPDFWYCDAAIEFVDLHTSLQEFAEQHGKCLNLDSVAFGIIAINKNMHSDKLEEVVEGLYHCVNEAAGKAGLSMTGEAPRASFSSASAQQQRGGACGYTPQQSSASHVSSQQQGNTYGITRQVVRDDDPRIEKFGTSQAELQKVADAAFVLKMEHAKSQQAKSGPAPRK